MIQGRKEGHRNFKEEKGCSGRNKDTNDTEVKLEKTVELLEKEADSLLEEAEGKKISLPCQKPEL